MNGTDVKKLLVSHDFNLNECNYFNNTIKYELDKIPVININKELLREKLTEKYGNILGNYIIEQTYTKTQNMVNPLDILKII